MSLPPLLCPSPGLLDQTFHRNEAELLAIADVLGRLQDMIDENRAHLILTTVFADIFEEFDFQRSGPYPLLNDIHRHLAIWFLQQHGVHIADLTHVSEYATHPVPTECEDQGLVELWADEVGRLLAAHDECPKSSTFFIGVACVSAFACGTLNRYGSSAARVFPLVGPSEISLLAPAYEWVISRDIVQQDVPFSAAKRNLKFLGGKVEDSDGTSHCQVKFKCNRTWPLDTNYDPVPDDHLRELSPITGYPLSVIKAVLLSGEAPPKPVCRLSKILCAEAQC